jgi:hypothetical protein
MPATSLLEWQKRFGTENACAKVLTEVRWPQGFQCRHQVSITADTMFHATKVPLVKWFWAIYLTASDKGGISALRLSKYIGVSWLTARLMLRKIRTAMAHRDSIYRLQNLIEFDDTYIGGKHAGKRGRGAEGKKLFLLPWRLAVKVLVLYP